MHGYTPSSLPVTPSPALLAATALLFAALTAYYLLFVPPRKLHSNFNTVPIIPCRFPGLGAVGFFANRYTFLSRATTPSPQHPHHGLWKFNLLGKVVYHVGGTDEAAMRAICLNRDLSFSAGNSFLFAGIQGAGQKGLDDRGLVDAEEKREMKAIAQAISPRRLAKMRTQMVSDAWEAFDAWFAGETPGAQPSHDATTTTTTTTVDLQKTYYPLIFRFTVRLMGMAEYASSPRDLARLQRGFWLTQRNSGFWTTMLPWFPQPRLLLRLRGAFTLWYMLRTSVKARIQDRRTEDDFAQTLIDDGMPVDKVARWVIGALLAGILNTIGTAAYTVAFLGASPSLRARARAEVLSHLQRNGEELPADSAARQAALAQITLEEWESAFPFLHLCFKETIRLLLTNSLNRYYPGPGLDPSTGQLRERLVIHGQPIEDDVYVTFSPPSALHDADNFHQPFTYDPDRYAPPRSEGGSDYSYIAWGAGHHKCTGMRFAKLEAVLALASLLVYADDFETVDAHGVPYKLEEVPLPDLSQSHWRAPTRSMRVRIRRAGAGQ